MKEFIENDLHLFMNALQLSIDSSVGRSVDSITESDEDFPRFYLSIDKLQSDERLDYFLKLIAGEWINESTYAIHDSKLAFSQDFINFLLITRLKKENMIKLAEMDIRYKNFVMTLGFKGKEKNRITVSNSNQIRKLVFDVVRKNKLTLRELAYRADVTQVTLSKFKAGKDIRLSSLLKIINALKLKIVFYLD